MRLSLYLFPFLMDLAIGVFGAACVIHSEQSGASYLFIGLGLGALPPAFYVGCAYLAGRFTGHEHVRSLLLLSNLVFLAMCMVQLVSPDYRLTVVTMTLSMAFSGFYFAPYQVLMMRQRTGRDPSRTAAMYNVAWSAGLGLGGVLGGMLLGISQTAGFMAPVVVLVVHLAMLWHYWPQLEARNSLTEAPADPDGKETESPLVENSRVDLVEYYLPIGWLAIFGYCFLTYYMRSVYIKTSAELLDLGPAHLGLLIGGQFLALTAVSIVWCFFGRITFKRLPLLAALAVLVVAMYLMAELRSFIQILIGFLLVGAYGSFAFLSSVTYAGSHPTRQGRAFGINEMVVGVGFLSGPLATGLMAHWYGYRPAIVLAVSVIGLVSLGIAGLALRKVPKTGK